MSMQAVHCKLLREGKWAVTDAQDLVPGDIVEIKIGDRVPADLRIVSLVSISL